MAIDLTRLDLKAELLDARTKIAGAIRRLVDPQVRPRTIRILTHTIAPLSLEGVPLLNKLRMLTAGGVTVTIIFGQKPERMRPKEKQNLKELVEANVKVYYNRRMHAKLILASTKGGAEFVLGSANLTTSALTYSHEIGVRAFQLERNTYDALMAYVNGMLTLRQTKPVDLSWFQEESN